MIGDMTTQDVVALNDFGGADLERRERTSAAGDTSRRYTISIKSEPILHNFDGMKLGAAPAKAIAELIREQIAGITAQASLSTELARKYGRTAYQAGKTWALKRYAGGKTGAMPPYQHERTMFNDSGRLARSVVAMENVKEGAWTINVAANRFDPSTFRDGEAGVSRMVRRLIELAPALGGDVLSDQRVVKAIADATADATFVVTGQNKRGSYRAWVNLSKTAFDQLIKPVLLG